MRTACYRDLMAKYENYIEHACDMKEGQTFIANGWEKPVACARVLGKACRLL